jgi:hypothetical protein
LKLNINFSGEPFSVKITCLEKSALPEKRKIAGGARRKLAPVHHQICDRSLIKAGLCLKSYKKSLKLIKKWNKNFENSLYNM